VRDPYAGLVPGLRAGLLQVNVRLPTGLAAGGAVPLELRIGNDVRQPGISVAIE